MAGYTVLLARTGFTARLACLVHVWLQVHSYDIHTLTQFTFRMV